MILHIGEYNVLFVRYVTLHRVQTARNFWAHELYENFLRPLFFCWYFVIGVSRGPAFFTDAQM